MPHHPDSIELPACLATQGWHPSYLTVERALWSLVDPADPYGRKIYLSYNWAASQEGWVLESALTGAPIVRGTPDELAVHLVTYLLTKEWPRAEDDT